MKTCTTCGDCLPPSSFSIRRDTKDGLAASCRSCQSARNKAWRQANPEKVRELEKKAVGYRKEYKSRPERKLITRELQARPEAKAKRAARQRARRATDKKFAISQRMVCAVNQSLRRVGSSKRGRTWQSVLGYSVEDLRAHLEAQFSKGMTWENIGEWHIDHIVPIAEFKFSNITDPEFLACWSLANLRPLWGKENLEKGDKRVFLL